MWRRLQTQREYGPLIWIRGTWSQWIIPMYLVSKKIHREFCQSLQQTCCRDGIVAFEPGCWRAASQPQPVPKWWQMKLQWAAACPGETGCFKASSCWAGYSTAGTALSETFAALCLAPRMLHCWNIKIGLLFFTCLICTKLTPTPSSCC